MSRAIPATESRIAQSGLSIAADGGGIPTAAAPRASTTNSLSLSQTVLAVEKCDETLSSPADWTCTKTVKISIFFDGTGNNLKADSPTLEHSNVARLYSAHLPNSDIEGRYSIYIPGIGTLFPEIGDAGVETTLGVDTHNGMGAMGQERLDYAFNEVRRLISQTRSRCKKIEVVRISVFGFSRGATLARAFLRDLLDPKLEFSRSNASRLFWKRGDHPLEILFVGIWDTVASVGAATGANAVLAYRSPLRVLGNVARAVGSTLATFTYKAPLVPVDLSAVSLAFSKSAVDPAPGPASGHGTWSDGLAIPGDWIAGRCVHMIAAHEQRNSFPLDSVLRGTQTPRNTLEIAYPGVHSDVGGGYRPGEGGRGRATQQGSNSIQEAAVRPSQISLRAMYDQALAAGVPLRRIGNPNEWKRENTDDFATDPTTVDLFNHYMAAVNTAGLPLGDAMLAHMRMYFAWRFQHIRHGGREIERQRVDANEKVFAADTAALQKQKTALAARREQLERQPVSNGSADAAVREVVDPETLMPVSRASMDARAAIAKELSANQAQSKEIDARIATLPSRGTFTNNLKTYDDELICDARMIGDVIKANPKRRADLRPHYRNLLEAYEAEFVQNLGLRDEKIIAFFATRIHDSLGDFTSDWTLPSDPRIIYTGGSTKLQYAVADVPANASDEVANADGRDTHEV